VRSLSVIITLVLMLAGCASQAASWRRADGMPYDPEDAKAAEAQCRFEFTMDKPTAREIEPCMSRSGYLLASK
jgi:hypothetical protein